jgi:hypothetical protein
MLFYEFFFPLLLVPKPQPEYDSTTVSQARPADTVTAQRLLKARLAKGMIGHFVFEHLVLKSQAYQNVRITFVEGQA